MDLIQKAFNLGFVLKNKEYCLWELQKWLREVHNIDILVTTINGRRLERYVSKIYINKLYTKLVGHSVIYEDTFEKGLQEALKLIK